MGLTLRRINPSKLVIHTDQGSQYTGSKYQKLLIENKINCSMSRKGNCWDNAAMESFFSTYKLGAPRKKSFLLALAAHKKNAFRQMLSATTPAKVKIDLQFI